MVSEADSQILPGLSAGGGVIQSAIGILPSESLYTVLVEKAEKSGKTPSELSLELIQAGLEHERLCKPKERRSTWRRKPK